MRVLLIGGHSFARAVFQMVSESENHEVGGVWTEDEAWRPKGHVLVWRERPPEEDVEEGQFDVALSVHNYAFVPREIREAPEHGTIGYHPSLLPRHRGNDAVRDTILSGDCIGGGTVYRLDDGLDTGPVVCQDWCFVRPGWGASDLWRNELFEMGVKLVMVSLNNPVLLQTAFPQDEELAEAFAR